MNYFTLRNFKGLPWVDAKLVSLRRESRALPTSIGDNGDERAGQRLGVYGAPTGRRNIIIEAADGKPLNPCHDCHFRLIRQIPHRNLWRCCLAI